MSAPVESGGAPGVPEVRYRVPEDPFSADAVLGPLLPLLTPWLAERRWYEGTRVDRLLPCTATVVREGAGALVVAVVTAHGPTAPAAGTRYQLLLGVRPDLPERLAPHTLGTVPHGPWAGEQVYDALADPALTGMLLRALAADRAPGLRLERAGRYPLPVGLVPRLLTGEQSNSAVAYGDRLLLKLYRRPEPGPHTESEVLRALTAQDCPRTPRLYGSLHLTDPDGESLTLGLIEEFVPGAEDGWTSAVRSARDHLPDTDGTGGAFTARVRTLGQAVAEVHQALARAFPRGRLSAAEIAEDAARMKRRLADAVREVPQLGRHQTRLTAVFDAYGRLAGRGCPVLAQRTHGDLHLGQALYTPGGWHIVDFEGEPATPAGERVLPQPVLRDVAGVLRSFDYAARTALDALGDAANPAEQARRRRRADAWALRNRRAFCAGYTAAGGEDPSCRTEQLTAFEAERAVYEAVYEARHRPHWLPVPLAAVHRLAGAVT
ncbi:hypothetical protein ACF1AL_13245 [Streptomyces sp. NPDC014801]|uniref:maltokinase N-terminal cap-like domain-containing protein n=1 Tax=Streptomyces sp. NPDC014801 TaxID=3364916 RepID=UPI0037005426